MPTATDGADQQVRGRDDRPRAQLAEEAAELAADEADRAEMAEVGALMESLGVTP